MEIKPVENIDEKMKKNIQDTPNESLEKEKLQNINKEKTNEQPEEKSLVKKGETSLRNRNVYIIKPIFQTTAGILFYVASFILSVAAGYTLIFSVFN